MKPQTRAQVECSLWNVLCEVAAGADPEVELAIFFEDFDNIKLQFPTDPSFTHWFNLGMQ